MNPREFPGVLQVVLSLASGGTERLVVETVKRLRRQFRMAVCCLDERGTLASELTAIGVPVTVLGRRPGFHPGLGKRIANLAEEQGASILHCHQYTPFVYGCCAKIWEPRTRVIFTEHGRLSDVGPSSKRRLANRLLRTLPTRVYTVSYDLRNHLVAEAFREGQVRVLHNGVKTAVQTTPSRRAEARQALDLPPAAFVIGAVGRLDPVKGLDTLMQAVATVRGRAGNTMLVLVGDGPERERIEADVRRLGLESAVRLVGYRSDVSAIMPAFDVFVNASTTEGISLTILEAMSAGLPVVATAVGGTPEVVIDGETGLLVPARDGEALAAAILTVRSLSDRGAQLGAMGRRRMLAEFSFDQMVDAYSRAYLNAARLM
ncbi:MAG: glycosyltransferase [Luteitalea sp.]|nr:glycosyltransferase [Luteitalea sp.]